MKFVVSSSALYSHMQAIGRVIASKNTLPILDCFLFSLEGQVLTITASDNENILTTKVDVLESEKDIVFAVNAKTIQDAMKEIPEQPLDFFVDENTLEVAVEYQKGKYRFMGQDGSEYPRPLPLDGEISEFKISSSELLASVGRAIFATAEEGIRPIMTGVYFDRTPKSLNVVASDGHKLVKVELSNVQAEAEKSFVLPKKPALLLKNLLAKIDTKEAKENKGSKETKEAKGTEVTIRFNNRNAVITTPEEEIYCRLIEGKYPNYESVVPKNNENEMIVKRMELLSALRRVMVFSNATALLKLELSEGKIVISSQDIDFSMSAREEVLCEYKGEPMRIGFKAPFLFEMINNIDSEEVVFKLADSARAGLLSPAVQQEGINVLMLLMPMMLND